MVKLKFLLNLQRQCAGDYLSRAAFCPGWIHGQPVQYLSQEGSTSTEELLHITADTVGSLQSSTAAMHSDAIWSFALKVLAFRQEPPTSIQVVRPIEDAAIQLILRLTLKLTEPAFKPLFLRLVDWAATLPASGADPYSSNFYVSLNFADLSTFDGSIDKPFSLDSSSAGFSSTSLYSSLCRVLLLSMWLLDAHGQQIPYKGIIAS